MGFVDTIQNTIQNHFDKKAEEREMMEKLQLEANLQQRQIFEQEYKKNALEVAKARAKKQASEMSGLRKLRALNRARNLDTNNQNPGSFFSKMSEYTQNNIAKRQENMKKTQELREQAKKMREDELQKRSFGTKPFRDSRF